MYSPFKTNPIACLITEFTKLKHIHLAPFINPAFPISIFRPSVGSPQAGLGRSVMQTDPSPDLKWPSMQHNGHMGQICSNWNNGWNIFQESSKCSW